VQLRCHCVHWHYAAIVPIAYHYDMQHAAALLYLHFTSVLNNALVSSLLLHPMRVSS
jgi:uncharacterized membrane protein YgdD (TMEM256/DUF423 family)